MRLTLWWFMVTTVLSPPLVAQEPTKAPPFALAVGPTWSRYGHLTGLHVRGEYYLMRDRWLGLRVDAGGRWTPTQTVSSPSGLYGDSSRYEGTGQAADVHLGLTATLTPWPHSRLAPYLLTGVAAVQRWSSGGGAYTNPDGSLAQRVPERAITRGSFAFSTGSTPLGSLRMTIFGKCVTSVASSLPNGPPFRRARPSNCGSVNQAAA